MKRLVIFLTFVTLHLSLVIHAAYGEPTAYRFLKLIDGRGNTLPDAVVVVDGEKITSVSTGDKAVPSGSKVIDLRGYTAIPGLIDAHTHITYYWDRTPGTKPWVQLFTLPDPVTVYLAQENARRCLEAGVTTVRDLGSYNYDDVAMRDLINRGAMVGPRLFVAAHGLHITSYLPRPGNNEPDPGRADGVAEVQRAARLQLAAGADWIKMYGSTGSDQDVTGNQTFTYEEMKAAADVAHQAGKRLAIHSYGPAGAKAAIRAGADSLEHATDMDQETITELARSPTFYVPTVAHNQYYIDHKDEFGYDQAVVDRLKNYIDRNFETLKLAIRAKVKIAMGSDAVFTGFGENTRELDYFVRAGMTPGQALATANANAAAMLGMEKSLGAVAPGYFADIVAVKGDPATDIQAVIDHVVLVVKGGKIVVDKRIDR